jgi:hypothetical protein
MSELTLKRLVGLALLDREFCEGLMNGQRPTLLAGLDLTEEEREVVTSLECGSMREFVGSLCEWINSPQNPIAPEAGRSALGAG